MECKYDNLYKGDTSVLKDCFPGIQFDGIQVDNPLNRTDVGEKCYLLNSKKERYYNIKYNPSVFIDKINEYPIDIYSNSKIGELRAKYIEALASLINMEPKDKCCKCISFTYYAIDVSDKEKSDIEKEKIDESTKRENIKRLYDDKLKQIYGYLSSLQLSIINITNNLQDFVGRIYVDVSLFITLENSKSYIDMTNDTFTNIIKSIEYLFRAENVEIYMYACKSHKNNLAQLRSMRFLPMIDPLVACCIIREADGFVTNLDCYNINNFVESKKLLFGYNISKNTNFSNDEVYNRLDKCVRRRDLKILQVINKTYSVNPYSIWLQNYQNMDINYQTNSTLFDLYAGLTGINFQVRSDKFYEIFSKLKHNFIKFGQINNNELTEVAIKASFNSDIMFDKWKEIHGQYSDYKDLYNEFNIGFDEIFLMKLFTPLYSYPIVNNKPSTKLKGIDLENIHFIMNNIFIVKQIINISEEKKEFKKGMLYLQINDDNFIDNYINSKQLIKTNFEDICQEIKFKFIMAPASEADIRAFDTDHKLYAKIILSIFDLSIKSKYYKILEYGIDVTFNKELLSHHLNLNISKQLSPYLIMNLYNGMYGRFDLLKSKEVRSEGAAAAAVGGYAINYKEKYIKYKQKYLELKLNQKYL